MDDCNELKRSVESHLEGLFRCWVTWGAFEAVELTSMWHNSYRASYQLHYFKFPDLILVNSYVNKIKFKEKKKKKTF